MIEERRYDAKECLLEGELPSTVDILPGCTFNTRCPLAFERCWADEPGLVDREEGRHSACFWATTPAAEIAAAFKDGKVRRPAVAVAVA